MMSCKIFLYSAIFLSLLCPYHRQKKIEKEEKGKKRIINSSDKYKYPGNDHIPYEKSVTITTENNRLEKQSIRSN